MTAETPEKALPLLLEIGTEEIPARFLPGAISDLKKISANMFDEYRIPYKEISAYATPRRLVLLMSGVEPRQKDAVREVFGPSKKVAFDSEGRPTKAAEGFAGSLGIRTTDLVVRTKGKGEYLAAVIEEKGGATSAVLPDLLRKTVLSLRFPKSMRWGNRDLFFVRPIHWIVSIFGPDTVTFEIDGIRSSNTTRGHRFLSPASFQVKDISSYLNLLENNYVIVDPEKRKKTIREGISAMAVEAGGQPVIDEDLLGTVMFLVELPVPVLCGFSPEYLSLPKELLITVMKDHQKYFAVQSGDGTLLNRFIVISNTRQENAYTVRTGAERVIRARFDDAKFYFAEDTKKTLAERFEDLRQVTFHDQLGSLYDKTGRIMAIASFLADRIDPSLKDKLQRAARLCKTDLMTGVVREFPELQGVMGKYYARLNGEDEEVAEAMEEQYLPKSFGDRLPATETGALLSLADKIDNVASFFAIGLVPTGSEDPFALRRQAMAIASLLMQRGYAIPLLDIFREALAMLSGIPQKENTLEAIISFMEQRIEYILSSAGFAQDLVKSVLPLSSTSPLRATSGRIEALQAFRNEEIFPSFLLAVKRANNIVPATDLPPVREELLGLEEEKNLFHAVVNLRKQVPPMIASEHFREGLMVLSQVTAPVNHFFDKVLVMDKDEQIKTNRLSLLKEVWSAASHFADFSRLI